MPRDTRVKCKVCGYKVGPEAVICPKCGTPNPSEYNPGVVTIHRKPKTMGSINTIEIFVDEEHVADLKNDEKIKLTVGVGECTIRAHGKLSGNSKPYNFVIEEGQQYNFEVYLTFSISNNIKIEEIQ